MRTWERGTGITLACGTGASAVCVAGSLAQRTDRSILAHLPGGDLELAWEMSGRVLMTGRGGPADEARGLSAYVAAAAMGHAEASFNLANCLYAGVGCLPDRLAAKALYLRSRTLGCALRPHQEVRVQRRELKAIRALAQRFADPSRLIFLIQERQQELALMQAVASQQPQPRTTRAGQAKAWLLAAGVMVAVAGTLGQYLKRTSRDAGPTTLTF